MYIAGVGRVRKERRYHVNITVLSSIELVCFLIFLTGHCCYGNADILLLSPVASRHLVAVIRCYGNGSCVICNTSPPVTSRITVRGSRCALVQPQLCTPKGKTLSRQKVAYTDRNMGEYCGLYSHAAG